MKLKRLSLILLIAGFLSSASMLVDRERVQTGLLVVTVRDADTGRLTPCTIKITDAAGQDLASNPSLAKGLRCDGSFRRDLPAGRMSIRVLRGFETAAVDREITLEPGRESRVDIELQRTVNLRERGWYAGDSHVHMIHGERQVPVSFETVALAARAEDLQYLSLSQSWDLADVTPEALTRELQKLSDSDCFLTWNLEAPKNYYKGDAGRCLGHCWNLGLAGRLPTGENPIDLLLEASAHDYESDKPSYANFESHALIHELNGAVFYTHPLRFWMGTWGGQGIYPKRENMRVSNMAVELPLDVLVGPTFDGLDVITGSRENEADEKAFKLWAMLLNKGYRLAATGSSDSCFDRPNGAVPGITRVYTYLPDGFSLQGVTKATAAGRTFVTTGPLLLAALDGQPPGTQLEADGSPRNLEIEVWASGEDKDGLKKLEIVRNGIVWKQLTLTGRYQRLQVPIQEHENAWYCARVYGQDERRQRAISGAFFLNRPGFRTPPPAVVKARVRIVDAVSGQQLSGVAEVVFHKGPLVVDSGESHVVKGEATLTIPGTARLRVSVPGYTPVTLSPFLDNPELVTLVTSLTADDLLEWATFERIRDLLGRVELTFRLQKQDD